MGKDLAPARDPAPQQQGQAAPQQSADDHLAELKKNVPSPWIELIAALPPATSIEAAKNLRNTTYQNLFEHKKQGYEAFAAYLDADPTTGAYAAAVKEADKAVTADRQTYADLYAAIAQLNVQNAGPNKDDNQIQGVHGACLANYAKLSVPGRYYLQGQTWVKAIGDPNIKSLLLGKSTTLPLDPAAEKKDHAKPGADDAEKLKPIFEGLKAEIMKEDPNVRDDAARERRQKLKDKLGTTDWRVLDMLRGDVQVSLRIAAINSAGSTDPNGSGGLGLMFALDSVNQLWWSIKDVDQATSFQKIKAYLEARPGLTKEALALRSRVMMDDSLSGAIKSFSADQQAAISRLIARGTAEKGPLDVLHEPPSADDAVRAAVQVVALPTFQDMRSDQLFRVAIEKGHNKTTAAVDGFTTSAYEVCMRGWGLVPNAPKKDPESALPTESVNPTTEAAPGPEDLNKLEALYPPAVTGLANELDSWYVSDSKVVGILTTFENDAAKPDLRDLFRRAHQHPGVELTKRANQNAKIGNIRDKLNKRLNETNRQIAERVLGIRIDYAVVGKIDGQVQLTEDQQKEKAGGKIPLMQALREVKVAGDSTISQITRNHAQEMAKKLNAWHVYGGCKASDITDIFVDYRGKFGCNAEVGKDEKPKRVIDTLVELTGMPEAAIHPIELLSNTFRDLPDAQGDLASRIKERVTEGTDGCLSSIGLDPGSVAARAKKPEAPPAAGSYAKEAEELFAKLGGLQKLHVDRESSDNKLEGPLSEAGKQWAHARGLAAAAQPQAQGAQPAQQPPGATAAPASFPDAYKKQYGIDPHRHVIEIGRGLAMATGGDRKLQNIAKWLQVDVGEILAEQKAPTMEKEPEDLKTLSNAKAKEAAQHVWDGLHKGDVVKVRYELDGKRPEEQQRIKLYFAQLSGGIELEFYVRQALESAKTSDRFTMVGGEGVHAGGTVEKTNLDKDKTLARSGDERSWTEMLDISTKGQVNILTRFQVALDNSNKNEIFRLADDATPDERRTVLGDEKTMGLIRAKLEGVEYERVSATLTGTADMTTKLLARSHGDVSGGWSKFWSSTDKEGMVRDIKDYAKRRKEFHSRKLEDSGTKPDDPNFKDKVTALVKADLLAVYDSPDARKVIENEFNTGWIGDDEGKITGDGRKVEGMLLNGGEESNLSTLASDGFEWSSNIVPQVRALSVEQRTKYRNDPNFIKKVSEKVTFLINRKLVLLALQSNEPPGEDHVGKLFELAHQVMSTGGDVRKECARLSKDEIERLRGEPEIVSKICESLNDTEQERFRKVLGLDAGGALADLNSGEKKDFVTQTEPPKGSTDGKPAKPEYHLGKNTLGVIDQDELLRLDQLKQQSQLRLRLAAERSWITLLGEAVVVFNADFKPKFKPQAIPADAPAPGAANDVSEKQKADSTKLENEAKAHDTTLREMVWQDVKDVVFKAADENTKADKNDATIWKAVMKKADPSSDRLSNSFSGLSSKFNDDEEIEKTVKEASEETIIEKWSSVTTAKFGGDGGESFKTIYDQYKEAKQGQKEGDPPSPKVQIAAQRFQRYIVEPSTTWDSLVLKKSGSFMSNHDETTKPDQQLTRDNPQYAKYRGFLNDRIRGLDSAKVAAAIGAEGPDAAMVGSRLRSALTNFQQAKEGYAKERGINGSTIVAGDEGRELDRQFGDYKKDINTAEDQTTKTGGDISDRDKRKLDKDDEDFKARSTEYATARDEAAALAGQIVGAAIAIAVTAMTAGAGSPAAIAMYGAITAAAAATGEVATKAAIVGSSNYDIGSEGTYAIVTAAITGAITAGSMHYAGAMTKAILPEMAAATQGANLVTVAQKTAPAWQRMLKMGTQTAIQGAMTGFTDVVGSGLNPAVWTQGWDEGWYRALDKMAATIRAQPWQQFKGVVSAALSAGLPQIEANKGNELLPGQRVGFNRALQQALADMPTNAASGVVTAGMDKAAGDGQSGGKTASGVAGSVIGGVQGSMLGLHDGSVTKMDEATKYGLTEVSAHPEYFKSAKERELYMQLVESLHPKGEAPNAHAYSLMRDVGVRTMIGENSKFKELSGADQRKFLDYVREASTNEEAKIRAARDPHEAAGIGGEKVTYPAGSPAAVGTDLATKAETATRSLGEVAHEVQEFQNPKSQAETDTAVAKGKEGAALAKQAVDFAQDAVNKIQGQLALTKPGSPEHLELQRQLNLAASALGRAKTLGVLIESASTQMRLHASEHGWITKPGKVDYAHVGAGEIPPEATGAEKKAFEEAKAIFEKAKNSYGGNAEMAKLRWAEYLQRHGIAISGPRQEGMLEGVKEKPAEKKVQEADHNVSAGTIEGAGGQPRPLVPERPSSNKSPLDGAVAKAAFAEAATSCGQEKTHNDGDKLIVKVKVDGAEKLVEIHYGPPAGTAEGQMAALKTEGEGKVRVWLSDRIPEDQAVRAFGAVIAEAIALATKKSGADVTRAGQIGQIEAMLGHLEQVKDKPIPGKAAGSDVATVSKNAAENAKYESPSRLKAELDMLLMTMGAQQDGPAREQLLKELPATTAARLRAHLTGAPDLAFHADGQSKEDIPKPKEAAKDMPASSVLPGTPAETHHYTAADQKFVVELQLVFSQIKEIDLRLRQRDQKNTAGSKIAEGESMRRRDLVSRAQELMKALQLGGTDPAYYDARLKELEAVFPGVKEVIGPAVKERVDRRLKMEAGHQEALKAREEIIKASKQITEAVKNGKPFKTDRVIVGDGVTGITDVATLKGDAKGKDAFIDPTKILVLGGPDLLARMAAADPTMRWGQRAELFDPAQGFGETHAMFENGGEGSLQGLQEDAGDFTSVGAMNDAMDLARQRLGIARCEAKVLGVETLAAKDPASSPWAVEGHEVRVRIQIGTEIIEIYTHHTDITTGQGAVGTPDESILSAKDRELMQTTKSMIAADSVLTDKAVAQTLKGKRVFVMGISPTAAWAAHQATQAGAARVDWTGGNSSEAVNKGQLEGFGAIDRVAETLDPKSKVHTTTDPVVHIEPIGGGGAIVTFASGPEQGATLYRVTYDYVALAMGYDNTGSRPALDGGTASGSLLGKTPMGPGHDGSPALMSKDGHVRVLGGANFGNPGTKGNMTPAEAEKFKQTQQAASQTSSDTPGGDPRTMEYQSQAMKKANEDEHY